MKGDDISDRLLNFAVGIIRLVNGLPQTVAGRHIANQLVRSGTSAGSNYEEARGAESRADFIHKLGVSWKEARESWYWLRVIQHAELIERSAVQPLTQEAVELSAILGKSISTARKK